MTRRLIAYNRTGLYNVDGNVKRSSRMISNVFTSLKVLCQKCRLMEQYSELDGIQIYRWSKTRLK